MEPEGSLQHSQVPVICPFREPDRSSPCFHIHFLKIHLNIILPTTPGSCSLSFALGFPTKTLYERHPICATCPTHHTIVYFITWTILGEEYRSFLYSLCSFLHSPVDLSLLGPNILLSTLFSNTLSPHSSLNVSDQVSHPYTTTGKIMVLYISIFLLLASILADNKRFCTEW